ncbi:hypothetical protein LTR64_003249 [Lithohypha guttulata]|uniref:uncharacterized protein n=1 Tax=Lithohypha guttulata TaxID=1690604 RepID=UPI002DDEEF52|nr:hypothetical protein LTR51_000529 [Lithohypha guttulata]
MPVLTNSKTPNTGATTRTSVDDAESQSFEMDDSTLLGNDQEVEQRPAESRKSKSITSGLARHTLGLILLLCVVFLWTTSNFLGSSIFADKSYAKPFFLTYLNTSAFTLCIIPRLANGAIRKRREGTLKDDLRSTFTLKTLRSFWRGDDEEKEYTAVRGDEEESFLKPSDGNTKSTRSASSETREGSGNLGLIPTARLSLAFCILWFLANYFAMACLQYTTVASATILSSTSSVWTLLIGALTRTEKFTWRKLCGVLGSLAGIVLISQVDLNAGDDKAGQKRAVDEFPDKSPYELALGDGLALLSAVIYGFYTITLKKTTISALPKAIHMPTFFGFVGMFNIVLLLPLFPVLHFTKLEIFTLPPTAHIWMILLVNSVSSLVSDICWAYAMVFTSPLVVTVGLSLTIPLSLVGEMIIQGRFESWVYWIGAMVVVGSFVFVEREEKHEEGESDTAGGEEDLGEPGPAIFIEDYDEVQEELLRREESPALLEDEEEQGDDRVVRPS